MISFSIKYKIIDYEHSYSHLLTPMTGPGSMFVFQETSPDFSLTSGKLYVKLKQLTEVLKLCGFARSYFRTILASRKQLASQERYDFEVSN